MTRRERRKSLIRRLCHTDSARFTVTVGNSYQHRPGHGRDDLDMLTDDALDMVARDLAERDISWRRRIRENRPALRAAAGLPPLPEYAS